MADYVLFFPGHNHGEGLLERYGLADLSRDAAPEWWNDTGANGAAGSLCGWRLGMDPEAPVMKAERTWLPLAGDEQCGRQEGDVWLGLEIARPFVPKHCARAKFVPGGQWVHLADGHSWYVPIAARLPHRGQLNALGHFERVVCAAYQLFYERSAEYYGRLVQAVEDLTASGGEMDVSFVEGYEFCWEALALNYRVTPAILSALQVLDDAAAARVICTVICQEDISDFAFKKKNVAANPRVLTALAWIKGLLPDHAPTWLDFFVLGRTSGQ